MKLSGKEEIAGHKCSQLREEVIEGTWAMSLPEHFEKNFARLHYLGSIVDIKLGDLF